MGKYLSLLSEISENLQSLTGTRGKKKVEIPTLTHCQNCQKSSLQKFFSANVYFDSLSKLPKPSKCDLAVPAQITQNRARLDALDAATNGNAPPAIARATANLNARLRHEMESKGGAARVHEVAVCAALLELGIDPDFSKEKTNATN